MPLSAYVCVVSVFFAFRNAHWRSHKIYPARLTQFNRTNGYSYDWRRLTMCPFFGKCRSHISPYVLWTNWRPPYTHHTSRYTHTHTVSYVLAATHCNTSTSSTFLLHCHLSHTAHTVATHAATFRLFHLKRSCCAPIRRPSAVVRACVPFHSRHARWRMYCMHAILKCCLALSLAPKYLLLCVTTDRSCSRWVRHEAMPPHFSLHSSVVSAYSREQ